MKKVIFLICSIISLNAFALNYVEYLNSGQFTTSANVEKVFSDKASDKAKNLGDASIELQANNPYFKSFLFITKDGKYVGLTIDAKTGKEVNLKDLFVKGYAEPLNEIIKQKLAQNFGLTDNKFKGVSTWFHQEFYLNDGIINIILNDVTNVGNKNVIVPIFPIELKGLIK